MISFLVFTAAGSSTTGTFGPVASGMTSWSSSDAVSYSPTPVPSYPPPFDLLSALRRTRGLLEQGWGRNVLAQHNPHSGGMAFCLNGAAGYVDSLNSIAIVQALEAQIPADYIALKGEVISPSIYEADDVGCHFGHSRGNTPNGPRLASFNNWAPTKKTVLDLVDRAIRAEEARRNKVLIDDLKVKMAGPTLPAEEVEHALLVAL